MSPRVLPRRLTGGAVAVLLVSLGLLMIAAPASAAAPLPWTGVISGTADFSADYGDGHTIHDLGSGQYTLSPSAGIPNGESLLQGFSYTVRYLRDEVAPNSLCENGVAFKSHQVGSGTAQIAASPERHIEVRSLPNHLMEFIFETGPDLTIPAPTTTSCGDTLATDYFVFSPIFTPSGYPGQGDLADITESNGTISYNKVLHSDPAVGTNSSLINTITVHLTNKPDRDRDGVPDSADACPDTFGLLANGCATADPDTDGDGIPDKSDNCPNLANSNQADTNSDGIGDACEGKLTIKLQTIPASNQPFALTGFFVGNLTNGATETRIVPPGTYTEAEQVPPGWALSAISCTTGAVGAVDQRLATFTVKPGSSSTCTFVNKPTTSTENIFLSTGFAYRATGLPEGYLIVGASGGHAQARTYTSQRAFTTTCAVSIWTVEVKLAAPTSTPLYWNGQTFPFSTIEADGSSWTGVTRSLPTTVTPGGLRIWKGTYAETARVTFCKPGANAVRVAPILLEAPGAIISASTTLTTTTYDRFNRAIATLSTSKKTLKIIGSSISTGLSKAFTVPRLS